MYIRMMIRVDRELWERFKRICEERNVSVCEVVEGLIRDEARRY